MKILHLSHKPPFPTVDGGCLAMADLAQLLKKSGNQLSLFSLCSAKHPFVPSAFPAELYQNISIHLLNSEASKLGAFGAFLLGNNYITERFRNFSIEKELKALLERESFDIVILESSYTGIFLNLIRSSSKAKIVLRSHNIEHRLWQKRLEQLGFAERRLMKPWTRKFEREERMLWKSVDAILSISEPEQKEIENSSSTPTFYLPTSVRIETETAKTKIAFYFLGAMDWEPNRLAMSWFCKVIWPIFQKRNPDFRFHIAGKGLSEDEFSEIEGIVNHGFVPDAEAFLADKQVLINPLKTGQGIRIKALEAIGKGKAIISTLIGMEGLPFLAGEHYLEAETSEDFVAKMELAIENPKDVHEMVRRAQKVAIKHFSGEHLSNKLQDILRSTTKL